MNQIVSSLKSELHKLDVDKLVPVPVDLSKLSVQLKNAVFKKTEYEGFVKTDYNTKINRNLKEKNKRKLLVMIIVNILLFKNSVS